MAATTEGARAYHDGPFWRLFGRAAVAIDHRRGWDKLPTPLGILVLIGVRDVLRKKNLFDTTDPAGGRTPPPVEPYDGARSAPGARPTAPTTTSSSPPMGMAGSRFGRNVPIDHTFPETGADLLTPSPREVSRPADDPERVHRRHRGNALAASWLQFMIRDWFSHGKSPTENPIEIPLAADDPWPAKPMQILRTRPDPTRPPGPSDLPPTYANTETHWWDLSSIYGSIQSYQRLVRTGRRRQAARHARPG